MAPGKSLCRTSGPYGPQTALWEVTATAQAASRNFSPRDLWPFSRGCDLPLAGSSAPIPRILRDCLHVAASVKYAACAGSSLDCGPRHLPLSWTRKARSGGMLSRFGGVRAARRNPPQAEESWSAAPDSLSGPPARASENGSRAIRISYCLVRFCNRERLPCLR
jgi:hypothetical protein